MRFFVTTQIVTHTLIVLHICHGLMLREHRKRYSTHIFLSFQQHDPFPFRLGSCLTCTFVEANPIDAINADLSGIGLGIQIHSASLYADADNADKSRTIFASNVGNKQLPYQWVPFDPLRDNRQGLTWTFDKVDGESSNGVTSDQSAGAFFAAASTWNELTCSEIPLEYVEAPTTTRGKRVTNIDLGLVQWLLGFGGIPGYVADITHGGILPGAFFDTLAPGGSDFILGVAFTFVWLDSNGDPTDNTAIVEIYYNDNFPWSTSTPATAVDLETVALHEMGHALGQEHFGTIAYNHATGEFTISPRAVMNAAYTGLLRDLQGSDEAGHCSIWGDWPNN